ncbi:bcl-2/adenovirus E1B 19 kDa-interacting protein 2-like protein isoform X1 [Chelmon rostratus]|uniref:bcl-2/adenovirus E1B 19 kDa-interacting protein 2-like protein isoform X1 n=2 Tax=Chelmon rostratus TaxID=109905 RepID=UPI001BE9D58B|nr:bcl-2/adenovirus E1B 19 kDa-interacting protein 2-like protein isoform X1 [Chelmon rostratus]
MSSPAGHTGRFTEDRSPVGATVPPNIQDMELREEWQDDGFPRPLPEDCGSPEETQSPSGAEQRPAPPTSLALSGTVGGGAKRRLVAPSLSVTLSRRDSHDGFSAAALSATPDETPSLDINLEALETPSGSETGTLPDSAHELEWEDDLPRMARGGLRAVARSPLEQSEGLMELDQVDSRGRRWRRFCISGHEYHVNMSVLEPYLQVLSHGGYYGDEMNAIILFTSCYLPENTVEDYEYVMDNLFRYIVGTLDLMVSENYLLVYLCAMAPRNKLPAIKWLHQCYTSIDRRLKKDLKGLLVVHPAWYIKALITVVKPFISEKFSRKIRFIQSLQELSQVIPTDRLQIPDAIRHFDEKLNR